MSKAKNIAVKLLDKEYVIACPEEAEAELQQAAAHLNSKLQEIKSSGKIIGMERIAIMAALNISHEYIAFRQQQPENLGDNIKRLSDRIQATLDAAKQQD
ncbi:cell division protein ZapA [Aliamphritea hakodatensis]|uniref:cell division protein ZapA n=1 Tax=Aliamphritea hakodatensis TaxID=2895352 RepID=UPI0022FD4361|nr:cell division protein ZapA [Aliamphritea hakodatensis]